MIKKSLQLMIKEKSNLKKKIKINKNNKKQ